MNNLVRKDFDSRKTKDFSLPRTVQAGSGAHATSYPIGSALGSTAAWGFKLTTNLQLVSGLKIGTAVPSLSCISSSFGTVLRGQALYLQHFS